MKPENILLDENGNCALADFGISKILKKGQKTKSLIGTPEYVAPEIILEKGYDKSVDIWSYGTLLYEMVFGIPPFSDKNQSVMMNWIVKVEPSFPKIVQISDELKDLIKNCLNKTPEKRIGYKSTNDIKKHKWFQNVDWDDVEKLNIEPPIVPDLENKYDTSNFKIE